MAQRQLVELLWPEAASVADVGKALASVVASSVYLQQDLVRGFIDSTSEEDRFKTVSELLGAGRVTDLQVRLERAKLSWSKATNQLQEAVNQLNEQSLALEEQLQDLLSRKINASTSKVEIQWNAWWKKSERFGLKVTAVPFTAKDAPAKLDSAMKQLDAFERAAERRLQVLTGIQSDLTALASQAVVDVTPLKERVDVLRKGVAEQQRLVQIEQARVAEARSVQMNLKERNEQLRALAELALKLLGEQCPVCGQTHDRDATTRRLKKIAASRGTGEEPGPASDVLARLLNELSTKEKDLSTAQLALRTAEQSAKDLRLRAQAVARRLKDVGLEEVEETDRLKAVVEAIESANEQIRSSGAQREIGEVLSLQLSQASDQGRVDELQKEIVKLKGNISQQEAIVKERIGTGDLGQRIVEALRAAASEVVTGRLERIGPLLQAIYSRIDPHPTFRAVSFLSRIANKRGRLNTLIKDLHSNIESQTPAAILSSSQVNALAVSVFLALNLGAQPPLATAMLDDPLQSLDDVNLLGLVDLLRRTKDHRQLLVSTHDERFGNLLARKLRPSSSKQRTVVIELGTWSREGPVVKSREVEGDPAPLRLAAS